MTNRKSHTGFPLTPRSMTLDDLAKTSLRTHTENYVYGELFLPMTRLSRAYLALARPSCFVVVLGCIFDQQGSAMVPFERTMVVSYRLSIVTVVLSLTIAIDCLRRSNQQGKNFGRNGLTDNKPNFNAIWERHWAVVHKRTRYLLPFEHNVRTWQTDRPRNCNIDTNRRNRLSAMRLMRQTDDCTQYCIFFLFF